MSKYYIRPEFDVTLAFECQNAIFGPVSNVKIGL